jgi:hypothetical protein
MSEIPNDAVIQVPVDEREEQTLQAALWTLAEEPELGRRLGNNARRWALAEHAPDRVAERYVEAIQRLSSGQPRRSASWLASIAGGRSPDLRDGIVEELGEALFDLGAEEADEDILEETAAALEELALA